VKRAELNARWSAIYADRERIFLDVLGARSLPGCQIQAEIRARGTWWSREQFRQTLGTLVDTGRIVRTGWARTARYHNPELHAPE